MDEGIAIAIAVLVAAFSIVGVPVLLVILFVRTSRIAELANRVERLDLRVRQLLTSASAPGGTAISRSESRPAAEAKPVEVADLPTLTLDTAAPRQSGAARPVERPRAPTALAPPTKAVNWEGLIGRQALGWTAVVVLLFATAFFLRYAFENGWIGPLGRVAVGIIAGLALVGAGWRYHRRGWRAFSQMLTAAGIVLLYLATFSAFGFYHLLPQRPAGFFLCLIVVESGLLALRYDAPAIALMAVVGGLLTPVLMHTDRDQYASLFIYLAVLNAGVVALLLRRAWPAVGTVSLVGTQALFWTWYAENYHYAKLRWALGFQLVLYAVYLLHSLLANVLRRRRATPEDLGRMLLNAACWFAAAYVLLQDDYREWLGSLAVVMAGVYAVVARVSLVRVAADSRLALAALATSAGFIAAALFLQADAPWVALGWAAEGALLWWFGMRVSSIALRVLGGAFVAMAVLRVFERVSLRELAPLGNLPAWPILNRETLPALCAVACVATAIVAARRFLARIDSGERVVVALASVGCVLMVWYIVSVDLYDYLSPRSTPVFAGGHWRLAEMSLSIWWAAYATAILAAGFLARQVLLRWTALGLYGLTVAKVFLYDMQGLDEIYRILAFFVLAVVLGAAAWAYQRFQPDRRENSAAAGDLGATR